MAKVLSITVFDIPDEIFDILWAAAVKSAPEGFRTPAIESIVLNYAEADRNTPEALLTMLANAVTMHAVIKYARQKGGN